MKRILICDDEPPILRAAELKLRRGGFEVVPAADGFEAWHAMRQDRPDLLVTDCQMPRLNGCELCLRIQEDDSLRGLPIVMLTAKGFELDHDELRTRCGVSAVLTKPFSPRELLRVVQELLAADEAARRRAGTSEVAMKSEAEAMKPEAEVTP